MILKSSVRVRGIQPEIMIALMVAETVYREYGKFSEEPGWSFEGQQMVVTSINDGRHGNNSLHYKGQAVDLRTHNISNPQAVADIIKQHLGDRNYDVLYEGHGTPNAHLHIEFDPKY